VILTGPSQELILTSPANQARQQEVVSIPLRELRQRVPDFETMQAEDMKTHQHLPTQIDLTGGLFLIAVEMPASGRLEVAFVPKSVQSPAPLVFGREATERKDDFAWENQYVTYRVYGPALEATGEITSGIDVWSKRVPNFVIDRFYKRDAKGARTHNPALSYHKDDGIGLDSYLVGPTRGCGGTGIFADGKLWVSNNYTHLKQLSDGPVRFQFELSYAPWKAGSVIITETKRITLDAGTHLNKIESTFTFSGPETISVAAGLPIRAGGEFTSVQDGQILAVWDTPQDATAGRIATGIVNIPGQKTSVVQIDAAAKQALLVHTIRSGETFTYYAGSGWSKADMPTPLAWQQYLEQARYSLEHPIQYHWK